MRMSWGSMPQDVKDAFAKIRANLTMADAGFKDPTLFRNGDTSLRLVREALMLADNMMWDVPDATASCRRKFSLCLDCVDKNSCERYSRHLARHNRVTRTLESMKPDNRAETASKVFEARYGIRGIEDVPMSRPGRLVGKFVVLWRNCKEQAAKVVKVIPATQKVAYEIVSGEDKGKKFWSSFSAMQTVMAFSSQAEVELAEKNWGNVVCEHEKRKMEKKGRA